MNTKWIASLLLAGASIIGVSAGISSSNSTPQERGDGHQERERGEHGGREGRGREGREGGEGHQERERGEHGRKKLGNLPNREGKPSGVENEGKLLPISKPLSQSKYGAKLDMKYNPKTKNFEAVVKNVSNKELDRVRVEIHYIRRFEVGPSKPGPLKPGEVRKIFMKAKAPKIYTWNPHAEVNVGGEDGEGEGHAEGGERGHEGGREGNHEGGREGRREGQREGGESAHELGSEGRGQHEADLGGGGEGEEDGTQLGPNQVYDVTKKGVRLVLKWNAKKRAFIGAMKNVTKKVIKKAAVEVHFATMHEIGPTTPCQLKPGQTKKFLMKNNIRGKIAGYTAHAEVGSSEHEGGGRGEGHERKMGKREGGNEHGGERGRGERRREGRGREGRGEHGGK